MSLLKIAEGATPPGAQAIAIYFADEGIMRVGRPWASGGRQPNKEDPEITAITVTADLPGLHCDLERVRVWVGSTCVYECPMHMVEGVEYPLQEGD